MRDLQKMGYHGLVTLRGDQEPAKALLQDIARRRGAMRTVLEYSLVADSRGNGHAERAVRSVEEQIRLQKLALEERLGQSVKITHPVMGWLIEYAVDVLNKCQVGADGFSAFERLKGKSCRTELKPFGSRIMFRTSG